jgi:hypothetical protein
MIIKKAILRSFDSGSYTATVEITGSSKTYLEGVPVAHNLPAARNSGRQEIGGALF